MPTLDAPAPPSPAMVLLACVALTLAGAIAWSNSLAGPFIFDDVGSILENPSIRDLGDLGRVLDPPVGGGETVAGRPVLNLSFAINYAIGGEHVRGYHVTNIVIHLLAGLVLLGILRRHLPLAAATLIAAAWTLHPLQTESVTYIVQRAESLSGLLYLLTLYCVIRGAASRWAVAWYTAAVIACGLGMGTKEVVASLPILVLLYDRAFVAGSFRAALTKRCGLYAALVLTWVPLAWLIYTVGSRGGSAGLASAISPLEYAMTQAVAIPHYLRLSLWPSPLVLDYGTGIITDPRLWAPRAVLVLALIAMTVIALVRWPRAGFCAAAFFALLAPTSSFIPVSTQPIAEHRMYLALAGELALVGAGLHTAWRRLNDRSPFAALALASACGAAVLFLGSLTFERNRDYRSTLAIWTDTAAKVPSNARAWNGVGVALLGSNEPRKALSALDRAVELDPTSARAHNNRGNARYALGDYTAAVADYTDAIRLGGDFGDAYKNRAVSLYELGRYREAWEDVSHAIAHGAQPHPGFLDALRRASPPPPRR